MLHIASFLTCVLALTYTPMSEARPPRRRPNQSCFSSDVTNNNADESLPPCLRQTRIRKACGVGRSAYRENLTDSETQQCSFFEDSIGCGACFAYQGLITEDEYDEASSIFASASSAYCGGSETADLDDVVSSILSTASFTATGLWTGRGRPSTTKATEVSNYFTATAEMQGPGLESLATRETATATATATAEETTSATREAAPSQTTDEDDGASGLSSIGSLGQLSIFGGLLVFLLS
ncbi:hypothetical protein LIA77_11650 [Sarocladium implicatum]|nr:hypothetical protein LIA77_11650 [Sarocladium implicatum]